MIKKYKNKIKKWEPASLFKLLLSVILWIIFVWATLILVEHLTFKYEIFKFEQAFAAANAEVYWDALK